MASLFLAGLLGGTTHCAIMCAPFVFYLQQKTVGRIQSVLLWPYHLGRMTTYMALAFLSSIFLNYAFVDSDVRHMVSALVLALAGAVMLAQSVPLLAQYFPFLLRVSIPVPFAAVQKQASRFLASPGPLRLYAAGLTLGFIPCGLVMGVLLAVSVFPEPLKSVMGMGAFALGTIPSLVAVAIGGKVVATKLPSIFTLLSQWVVVLNGIVLIVMAFGVLS